MQPYFDPTRKTTSKKMEDNLKKKGRQPQKEKKKINLIGCDTIVNSPSFQILAVHIPMASSIWIQKVHR
jgi:hypothetical protein